MREVLPEVLSWRRSGETVALSTVVATFSSAPREPGAAMLVGTGGSAVGPSPAAA
ncbi:XdhC family protein [Nocardioides terrisoli]|uniref:XdhC family protein n=1 Tax=Nocardioides terrisoli TaxID=3388267 RepID=UPI00287B608E|nr:XdhC family protein [Nocardioides marmorisolisilvae]